jgi:hypothetical protein
MLVFDVMTNNVKYVLIKKKCREICLIEMALFEYKGRNIINFMILLYIATKTCNSL